MRDAHVRNKTYRTALEIAGVGRIGKVDMSSAWALRRKASEIRPAEPGGGLPVTGDREVTRTIPRRPPLR